VPGAATKCQCTNKSHLGKQVRIDFDEQSPLAIKHAPTELREHGLQEIYSFPLVSRGKGRAMTRKPARMAWRRCQEIELRTPNSFPALIFDCDSRQLRAARVPVALA